MANTLFKGDLAEVSFGKETGLRANGYTGQTNWSHLSTTGNESTLTFGNNNYWVSGGNILLPDNVLVGSTLKIEGGDAYSADNFATTKRTYYITGVDTTNARITVCIQLSGRNSSRRPSPQHKDGNAHIWQFRSSKVWNRHHRRFYWCCEYLNIGHD